MSALLLFSFLAGFITILAPCIWPLLPIVLAASSERGQRRPLGLTLGLMTSFSLLTLTVSYIEHFLHIDANVFRMIALALIGGMGLAMIIPSLGARLEVLVGRMLRPFQNRTQGQGDGGGFSGGYAAGFALGLVWAPCAGPILAAVATLAATQKVDVRVVLVTLAYVLGLGVPLFLFSLGGSRVFAKMRAVTKHTGRIQQAFGAVMIAAAILIYTGYDQALQLKILDALPVYGRLLEGVENNKVVGAQLDALRGGSPANILPQAGGGNQKSPLPLGEGGAREKVPALPDLGPAPDFKGVSHWLNASPLAIANLRGKVVLVDFWTYSCINCVRTLPYTTAWYAKYGPRHFAVIGVHTPEFAFEKKTDNVQAALDRFHITYPVAQDNDYATWNAYNNRYWPAEYLIDAKGRIRVEHFGEGHYDEMDTAIRSLLSEAGHPVTEAAQLAAPVEISEDLTPETYLGLDRIERFSSTRSPASGLHRYALPGALPKDHFAYEGDWTLSAEAARPAKGSALELRFDADKVYLVLGPGRRSGRIALFLDGRPVGPAAGKDVKNGRVTIDSERLYNLVDLKGNFGIHVLRIEFLDDGIAAYAFTFG